MADLQKACVQGRQRSSSFNKPIDQCSRPIGLKSLAVSLPTILVSRRPRQVGIDWTGAHSWLGGAPRLASMPWPRDQDGQPLHFLAQIDLAEVAARIGATSLPATGSLAFFASGRGKGAVIFVPQSLDLEPTDPPADTPELSESGGSDYWRADLSGRRLYPFWPLDFTALDLPPPPEVPTGDYDWDDYENRSQAFHAAEVVAIERHFKRRECNLSRDVAFAGPPIPDWWQTALYFADHLDKAIRRAPEIVQGKERTLNWAHQQVKEAHQKGAAELKKAEAQVPISERSLAKAREIAARLRGIRQRGDVMGCGTRSLGPDGARGYGATDRLLDAQPAIRRLHRIPGASRRSTT